MEAASLCVDSFLPVMDASTVSFITNDLSIEIMFFMIILSGCYIVTSHNFPIEFISKIDVFSKTCDPIKHVSSHAKHYPCEERSVVREIKERGNSPSWFQSMVNPKIVLDMWERAERKSIKGADLEMFSFLVQAYIRLDRAHMVVSLMEQMDAFKVVRTKDFFESTIRQLAAKRCFGYALSVLNIMEHELPDQIEATSYACAVNFCSQIGDTRNGIRYFTLLEQLENPSLRAYMVILRLLNKVGDWKLTVGILEGIKAKQIKVDGFVLNQALSTLVNADQVEHVRDIIFDDFFANIRTLISFNLYLKGLSRVNVDDNFRIALDILDYMETTTDFKPNQISYNTVIDFAVKLHQDRGPWDLVKRMQWANVPHDEYTVSILVRGLNMYPTLEKLTRVKEYLEQLENINTSKIDLERVIAVTLDHAQKVENGRKIHADILQFARAKKLRVKSRLRN